MPLVHRNTLSFVGMGSKQEYLVWLESEGEFTALDRAGRLHAWSTVTGMKLGQGEAGEYAAASENPE